MCVGVSGCSGFFLNPHEVAVVLSEGWGWGGGQGVESQTQAGVGVLVV